MARSNFTLMVPQVFAVLAERHQQSAPMHLPQTYRRLVGRHVGQSFREVCEEETVDISPPGEGKVCNTFLACLADCARATVRATLPSQAELTLRAPAQAPHGCGARFHLYYEGTKALPSLQGPVVIIRCHLV